MSENAPLPAAPPPNKSTRSPLVLRLSIWAGAALYGVLLIWLIGFFLRDVGEFRAIDYREVEKQFIGEDVRNQEKDLQAKIETLKRQIQAGEQQRDFLRDRVNTLEQTMKQMLDLQRMSLEKSTPINAEQQQAIDRSQKTYLDTQDQYQAHIEKVQSLRDQQSGLEASLAELRDRNEEQQEAARKEYNAQLERRDLQAGFLKILILLPLAALAVWLFVKFRCASGWPIVYATGGAVLWRLIDVIHEHFPSRYQKYILLLAALAAVLRILLLLIRSAASPGRALLIKRYREAYRKGQCPVCAYPIAAGSAPFAHFGRQLATKRFRVQAPAGAFDERPYTCPSCGENLFEACASCGKLRHTLLPTCRHCGAEKKAE